MFLDVRCGMVGAHRHGLAKPYSRPTASRLAGPGTSGHPAASIAASTLSR